MILVTAPTGRIGRHVVRQLADARVPVRVVARDPARIDPDGGRIDVVQGDLDRLESLDAAFRGVDRLFLLSPGPDVTAQDAALIGAARRAEVGHVVMVSSLGAELGGIAGGGPHLPGEALLRESGFGWTLLRPSEFMTNVLWWQPMIAATGALFVPSGQGAIGFVDPEDIASVAVHALTTPGHEGRTYRLTGPEALRTADLAAQLSELLGKPIRHVDLTLEAYRAEWTGKRPPAFVDMMVGYYAAVRDGRVAIVAPDVADLLGRPARSFATWARENVAALR